MAIPYLDNLNIKKKAPNVERDLFETIADMVAWSENYLPAIFPCYVVETGKRYVYNVSNSEDPVLGKWREDAGNGDLTNYYNKTEIGELLNEKTDQEDFEKVEETVTKLDGDAETEGSVKSLDAQVYKDSKDYTDEQIAKLNKKKSISCDEKPFYNGTVTPPEITYKKNGENITIPADEIWFYYMAENDLNNDSIISLNEVGLAQTIWIDGEEFTIMSFGMDMSEYVNKSTDVTHTYTGEEVETGKIPDIAAMQKLEEKINKKIDEEETDASDVSYENENYPLQTNVKKALDAIWAKLDYVKPAITSFTMTPSTTDYEVGQEVTEIDFAWAYNKDVSSQSLTDVSLEGVADRSGKWTGSLKTSKTFTLTCGDGENSASASKTISFKNKVYFGSAAIPEEFNSEFVLGLSKNQFGTTYKGKYAVTVGGGEFGFICCPASWNMPNVCKIGGFGTDLVNCGNFSITNASGGVVTYKIVRTSQAGLGAIEMLFE